MFSCRFPLPLSILESMYIADKSFLLSFHLSVNFVLIRYLQRLLIDPAPELVPLEYRLPGLAASLTPPKTSETDIRPS